MFQDVIFLARRLNTSYVWIDALCVVQDDEKEQGPEIAKMDNIYRNAILNVGATAAVDSHSDLVYRGCRTVRIGRKLRID
jgi:hypothetical protein